MSDKLCLKKSSMETTTTTKHSDKSIAIIVLILWIDSMLADALSEELRGDDPRFCNAQVLFIQQAANFKYIA